MNSNATLKILTIIREIFQFCRTNTVRAATPEGELTETETDAKAKERQRHRRDANVRSG